MELQPCSEAGRRFVAIAEEHQEVFRQRAGAHDRDASFAEENFEDLKRSGAVAAFVPERLGGLGLDSVQDWAAGLERLGRADSSTAIALNMHLAVSRRMAEGWRAAVASGDVAAREHNEGPLRASAGGELVICATATEAGTAFLRPSTTATRVDGGWRLDGRKIFVTLSPIANLMVLNLRVPDPEGIGSASPSCRWILPASSHRTTGTRWGCALRAANQFSSTAALSQTGRFRSPVVGATGTPVC